MSNLPKNIFVTTLGLLASSLAFNTLLMKKTQTISMNQISSKTSYTLATAALKNAVMMVTEFQPLLLTYRNVLAQLRADQGSPYSREFT